MQVQQHTEPVLIAIATDYEHIASYIHFCRIYIFSIPFYII